MSEQNVRYTVTDLYHAVGAAPPEVDPAHVLIARVEPDALNDATGYSRYQDYERKFYVQYYGSRPNSLGAISPSDQAPAPTADSPATIVQDRLGYSVTHETTAPDELRLDALFGSPEDTAPATGKTTADRTAELLSAELQVMLNEPDIQLGLQVYAERRRLGRPMRITIQALGALAGLSVLATPVGVLAAEATHHPHNHETVTDRALEVGALGVLGTAFAAVGTLMVANSADKAGAKQAQRRAKRLIDRA